MNIRIVALVLCLSGCSCVDRSASDSSRDLVAWWTFDEGHGPTAADSSGVGNTATIRNGGWDSGRRGGALQMNGGNDSIVTVPLSESLDATHNRITIMSWTYRTAEHNVAVVAHEYPTLFFGFHGPQFKWQITGKGGKGATCYADPRHRAVLNKWIHMAATYDGWTARLYVDGVEICRDRFWGSIAMPDSPFTISGYLDESGQIVDEITGKLDDVKIYRRVLGESEIMAAFLAQ